jgi:5-methyltetrahydrofolate--homocysteine methyltransferase
MINDIAKRLKDRILILDGAMGTILQNQGMQPGDCPEWFGIQNPGLLEEIHYQYVQAGADIIQTNTFGANRCKLNEFGLADQVQEINAEAVRIARQAARDKALVAASIGPTGKMLHPLGDADFDFLYQVFGEQAVACEKAGAQLISIETMSDIGEMRAALIAVRQNTRLPIIAHMTFENSGRTMMGTDPLTALLILEALQPMAIGANCSGGARELLPVMETMGRYARTFLSVEPNAGMPQLINGHTVFPDAPEEMAEYALKLREAGANIIGGCCGTTPDHIQAMARALQGIPPLSRKKQGLRGLASRSRCTLIGEDYPLAFIGERINPTARKKLAQDIKEGSMQMVVEEARKQCLSGAPILDINMGVPGIDEATAMKKAVIQVQTAVDLPLSIDSVNFEAIENGLKNFVGRALINSTSGEEKQLSRILPLAKKYGAAVLGLCLDENGIPDKAEGRLEIARRIYNQAREYGLRDEDIYIDGLVKTASAEQSQVMETLKALQLIKKELPVGTVLGISNVSHGLPARDILTSAYLAMAWGAGLDLPIMNPFDEKVMDITRAAAVLLNRDQNCSGYIEKYKDYKPGGTSDTGLPRHPVCSMCNIPELISQGRADVAMDTVKAEVVPSQSGLGPLIQQAVLNGNSDSIESLLDKALREEKLEPLQLINQYLIPGIEEAGQLYDKKKYFLPQLMMAAETMKKAFAFVKPYLKEEEGKSSGVIVMATVEGDIHDIGKNIVTVLLENYGFKVLDLGKDVKAADILQAAEEQKADIIGLSALMTTTMSRMKEVIEGVKARGLNCRVMVGGAVLNQEYADSIGADAYGEDARQAVLVAQSLLKLY